MKVFLPTPLRSYAGGASVVDAEGSTIGALLSDLDRRFPGIRFRMIDEQDQIRPHMRIFVNGNQELSLDRAITSHDEIQILQALSGG